MRKLNPDETSYFCEQLAIILNAGMPLSDGMEILCEDIDDKRVMKVCRILSGELNKGNTLAASMEKSNVFPKYAIKMSQIGEVTGQLEKVLLGLADYYEDRAELSRTVRSAVLHPLMLLVMMTAVIVVLIVLVIPMFGEIFSQFDSSIGTTVKNTVDIAYTMGTTILLVLLGVIALFVIVALLSKISGFKNFLSRFASVFPLTKKMSRRFSLSKISDAMSMMVSAGIAPDESLEYATMLIDDKKLKKKLMKCRERVLGGEYFADVIASSDIFPSMYAHSLKIAYKSGSFEKSWTKLSERCGEAAMESASGLVSFIEPAIVIVLTAVIGAILLTVMIPLMNIMSVLG